jgi:hypothetical protein
MTLYREAAPGEFVEWNGEPVDGIRHPLSIETLWPRQVLEGNGFFQPEETLIPEGHRLVSRTVARVNGTVRFVDVTEPVPVTQADVDTERDRRIAGGLTFGGVEYQTRPFDRENIAGAAQLAALAIQGGAIEGELTWHGGEQPFVWIAADNSIQPMDAQTVVGLGKALAGHIQSHIFAARALKDADPIPADYRDDGHWPQ